jgi:hypothetical protein
MATNGSEKTPLRIVVGSDDAGHGYKQTLKEVLSKHAGVAKVLDVGVLEADDKTAYPHLAVDACKKIKAGEVRTSMRAIGPELTCCRPIEPFSFAVLVWVWPSPPTRSLASEQ